MKVEGVTFNGPWVASQSLQDFIKHEEHHGLTEKQLKDVHKKCVKEFGPAKEEKKEPAQE